MLREWRRRRRFTRALRQTLNERRGHDVSEHDYQKCIKACDDRKKMGLLMKQTEVEPGMLGGIRDWDWDSILNWVQTFLIPLIRALLPLMLLLDEEK